MSRMVIDDEMWSRLEKLLPKPKGRHGKDDRLFMLRAGAAWRDLPPDYGNWKSVYNRYNNWSKKGYITETHPFALLLVQAIAYGDLKKSEELLQAHPGILKPILTEKVTVQDYSRRKIKQKTAFQTALCAIDDKLCVMYEFFLNAPKSFI